MEKYLSAIITRINKILEKLKKKLYPLYSKFEMKNIKAHILINKISDYLSIIINNIKFFIKKIKSRNLRVIPD